MLVHVELMQTSLCHLKIVFTNFRSCFKFDAPMQGCDQLQTRLCVGQGEMIKAGTLLKKRLHRRFTYLAIKLSFKLVYYCVFFFM